MKMIPILTEKIAKRVVEGLALILFCVVTVTGAFSSACLESGYSIEIIFPRDSLVLNLIFFGVLFSVICLLTNMIAKNMEKRRKLLLVFTMVYAFGLSLVWAAVSKSFPTADQASVYYGAKHFAADYFAEIAENGSYFSCYPHQMGLALFYEVLFRIFHTESFHLLQGVNAVCNSVIVLALYKITDLLFENKKASVYLLFLMILCFPLFWYAPFVYGELPSFAFSFAGFWLLLEAVKQGKNSDKKSHVSQILLLVFSLILFVGAVAVRKNTLIMIIALVLTLAVYMIKERKFLWLVYLGLLIILCTQINSWIISSYEKRSGGQLNAGVPAISHAVMGLQESQIAPGWYNGFNFITYAEDANYNQEEAVRLSKLALAERLEEFSSDPGYTFRFFRDKFRAEWQNSGYACIYYTAGKYYDRLPLVESFYSGATFHVAQFFMDKYQFGIYLMAFVFLLGTCRLWKKENISQTSEVDYGILRYTFLVTIIGGALFYLVWEGNGRYILPYFLMTIPYAAAGLEWFEKLPVLLSALKNKKTVV